MSYRTWYDPPRKGDEEPFPGSSDDMMDTIAALRARVAKLEDAGENVIIAFSMGWDMDGVIEGLCAALKDAPQ